MDERRFRTALDTITDTISEYGEDTIIAAFRVILDRFNYEVVPRDMGPDDDVESGNVWPRESDDNLLMRAFGVAGGTGKIVNLTRRVL